MLLAGAQTYIPLLQGLISSPSPVYFSSSRNAERSQWCGGGGGMRRRCVREDECRDEDNLYESRMRENRSCKRVREFGDTLFSAFRLPSVRSVNPQIHKPKSPPLPQLPVLCLYPLIHTHPHSSTASEKFFRELTKARSQWSADN